MRKPRQHRRHQKRRRCKTVFRFETLEQRLALSVTPLAEHFASAAMEAVARGELTSEKWIIREISHERIAEQCALAVQDNFGGQQGWQARPIGSSFFRLSTPGVDPSDVVDWARSQTSRFVVEPDLPIHVQVTPNDSSMNQLYGLHNYGQYGGTVDADIDAIEAWDITTGSQDVVVGVIDSGIDITHPDLAANIWQNPGEIAGNGIDDDGNGFIDDVHGWDFHDDDNTPNDGNGHGTHVAGTIGAVGNNGNGIVGVNWQVSLLPLRFLGDDGYGWTSDAVAAVNYATMLKRDFGINVVATNNSWGGGGYSTTLYQAIQEANQHGIMFVAAAGNNSSNNDVSGSYPANYDLPNVLSVAALNRNDNLAGFSNYGVTTVDVGAPGVSIYSTLPGNSYGSYSGTSMAAPHVAGVVALMHAASPGLSVIDVGHAIRSTVDPVASLSGKTVTGGRINAAAAISSVLGESPVITPLENLLIGVPGAKNIDVVATDSDGGVTLDFTVTDYSGAVPPADVELVGSTLTITPIEGQSGSFTLNVIASDLDSNTSVASFTVEILSPIESNGSVVLNRDASGLLYADESPIYDTVGKHVTINHYSGWETLGVEVVGGENHVLWEYGSTGRLHYWRTDGNWSWQASFGEYYDGSSEYYLAETQFGLDINADGTVGAPVSTEPEPEPEPEPPAEPEPEPEPALIPIESNGSVVLNRDASGLLYADESPIYDPGGKHVTINHYSGWETLGVEVVGGENHVLWEYGSTGRLHYWRTDGNWSWQASFGEYYDGSSEYYLAETQFGLDINADGTVGAPVSTEPEPEPEPEPPAEPEPEPEPALIPIESNGSVVLNRDASGLLYADESPIYDPGGKHVTINHYSGWETLGVEVVGGENHVLWEYGSTGRLHYWRTDGNWSWQASFGEYYDGSSEYYLAETQFGLDINADGTVGAPVSTEPEPEPEPEPPAEPEPEPEPALIPIESNGSVVLNRDASGLLYADESPIYDPGGKHVTINHYSGWETLGVEVVGGENHVLWEYGSTGRLHYWRTDGNWSWQASFGEYYDGSSEYYLAETQFGLDINADGTVGQPPLALTALESNGSVVLNRDASGLLYADESPIYDPGGKHVTINHYSGWETLGVEVVGGENHVLWEYGSTGRLHYWRTDGNWSWQTSFGEYYDGSSEYYLAETQFGLDINADGTVGAPVSTEPQDFPSSVLPGISIGSLPSNYETSGLTWHEGMQKLFAVSDEGIVSMMNEDGSDLVHWTVPGDLEAITVADHTSNFVYIGVEHPDSILEFDVSTGQVTRTFSLTDWMTGSPNLGLEALAFVPDESHAEGGVFYAGLQQDGQIYRFELPVLSSQTSTDVLFIDTLTIEGGHPDLADLAYDPSSGLLLAMFDVIDRLKVLEKDGALRKQWTVPGNQQEAIIYVGNKLFVGDDSTGTISLYTPFESLTT